MRRLFLALSLLLPVTILISSASMAQTKLDASIFSYDGKDFVRTETTLIKTDNRRSVQNLTMIARPTKPLSKNTPTSGQRPFLDITTKRTTHRSSDQTAN
jgi:hypothetical protein